MSSKTVQSHFHLKIAKTNLMWKQIEKKTMDIVSYWDDKQLETIISWLDRTETNIGQSNISENVIIELNH